MSCFETPTFRTGSRGGYFTCFWDPRFPESGLVYRETDRLTSTERPQVKTETATRRHCGPPLNKTWSLDQEEKETSGRGGGSPSSLLKEEDGVSTRTTRYS